MTKNVPKSILGHTHTHTHTHTHHNTDLFVKKSGIGFPTANAVLLSYRFPERQRRKWAIAAEEAVPDFSADTYPQKNRALVPLRLTPLSSLPPLVPVPLAPERKCLCRWET